MKLTRRKFFFGAAAAAVVAPVLALLPSRRAALVLDHDVKVDADFTAMWREISVEIFGPIAPGHGGFVEIEPGKIMWVNNQTSDPMSREPWVEAFPS